MKKILISIYMLCCLQSFAQKKVLDTSALHNWPMVNGYSLSGDGKFFYYTVHPSSRLILMKVAGKRIIADLEDISAFNFTANRNLAVYIKKGRGLALFNMNTGSTEYVPEVQSYTLLNNKTLVIYKINDSLHVKNLDQNKKTTIAGVADFYKCADDKSVVFKKHSANEMQELYWWNATKQKIKKIWNGSNSDNFIFQEENVAFTEENESGEIIWWYSNKFSEKAENKFFNKKISGNQKKIVSLDNFSLSGKRIFFWYQYSDDSVRVNKNIAAVDVWSYMDPKLYSEQEQSKAKSARIFSVLNLERGSAIELHKKTENAFFDTKTYIDSLVVKADCGTAGNGEGYWNNLGIVKRSLISLNTGSEIQKLDNYGFFSPGGRYWVYMDKNRRDFYCLDIRKSRIFNLTETIEVPRIDTAFDAPPSNLRSEWHSSTIYEQVWMPGDTALFLCDKYDIWLLDPENRKKAINITNGYGRKKNISFTIVCPDQIIRNSSRILLQAFNHLTKESGFYSIDLKSFRKDPEMLSMGSFIYEVRVAENRYPLTDAKATGYIVARESAEKSKNYFLTTDFKSFSPLSEVYPESKYNWITTTLLNWKGLNGCNLQGILYKPENFDASKKYPVIIQYYEKMSERLNQFEMPALSGDFINVPWFVSNGYIVVEPDIQYETGATGKSAVNSVVALANYLKQFSYIDSNKIGIKGHSFGGFETNYLVTHSNIFAAAISTSGPSDLIREYTGVAPGIFDNNGRNPTQGGHSLQWFSDIDQFRIGSTLWHRPDLYIENSPVLCADKVTTPLLMMNNKLDAIVAFDQGIAFFTSLRRLGKKVWMLQYDGEAHSISTSNKPAQFDYTTRMMQFFDHYLKGKPAPVWMTRGISFSQKGVTDGLEYDVEIKTPLPSPLIDPEKDPTLLQRRYEY